MRVHICAGHLAMHRRQEGVHRAFQSQSRMADRLVYHSLLMLVAWLLTAAHPAPAQLVSVTTYHNDNSRRGFLRAYDAHNLAHELYNSEENFARDDPGAAGKFTVPTIANGKVYFTTHKRLVVYGLLP